MMETLNNQAQTDSVHSQSSRSLSRSLTPTNETTTNYDNSEENLSENEDASSNPTTTPNINDSKNLHIELIRPMESDDNVKEKKENVAVVVEYCQKDDCNNKSDNLLEKGEEYKTLNLSETEGSCDIVKNEKSPLSISSTYDENEFDKTQSLPITEKSISVEQEKEENYSPENKHHQEEDILSNFAKIAASLETITAAGSVNSDTQQTNSSKEYNLKVEDDNSASHCYSPESSEPEEEATKESTTKQISCERFKTYDSKKDNNISSSVVQENYENDDGSGTRHNNKSNSNNNQSSTQQSLLETTAEYRNNAINTKLCEQTIDNILAENASREKYEILENHAIATFQNSLHQKFKERTYSPLNEWNSTTIGKEIPNVDETIKDEINAEEEKNKREAVVRLLQINGEGHSKSPLMCTESGSNQNLNEDEQEEQYQKMKETIPTTSYMPLKTQFMTTLDTINSVEKRHYNLEQRTLQLPQYGEDDASRSSIVSSASFSSNTSSSQHLVIDHPMDDMKEEKMKPMKKTMKRKYSATGTQRQQQQQHVDEGDDNEEPQQKKYLIMEQPEHRTCNESDNFESLQLSWQLQHKKNQLLPQTLTEDDTDGNVTQNAGSKEMVTPPVGQEQQQQQPRRSSPYKSLLLQQLEKPLMPPPVLPPPPPPPSIVLPSPQAKRGTIETIPQLGTPILTNTTTIPATPVATTPPLPDNTVTKYLCFQCKTGSFDSLTALTDHQMTCLNNTVLPINNSININSKQKSMATVKKSIWHKPMPPDASRTSKLQYYKCSSCQTYYENWALVLHIREQHNRYACSYCIRVFQTVEKLALHLEIKHDLEQNHYACEEALRESMILVNGCPKEARYLMCCTCQHVFHEEETFSQHDCSELIKPCTLCGQKGRHTSQCKAHPDAKCFAKPRRKKDKVFGMEKTSSGEFLSNAGGPLSLSSLSSAASSASPLPVPVPYNQTTINSNNNIPVTSLNCDKSPMPMDCRVDDAGDDSNSSSNMVIDESCTTSHPISQTNPFKELDDEHERLEKQETQNYTKDINEPPDRGVLMMPMANASLMPTTTKNLIVPKFKLRVPKEFQKSVDAAFTTSESDEDDDNDDDHDDEDNDDAVDGSANHEIMTESVNVNVLESGIATEKPLLNAIDIGSNQTMSGDNTTNLSLDEDESIDEPNTNLMRIMEEIERTKMDIQRTKQRRSSHKSSAATTPQPHHSGHHEPPCSTPPTTDSNVREQETLSTPSLSNSLTETDCGYSEASATVLDGHNETSAAQGTEKMDIDENIVAPANISGNELELNNGATMQTTSTENDALNEKMETNETTTLSTQEKFDQLPATTLILNPDNHQLPPIDETIKAKAEEQEQEINVCNSEGNKDDNKILDSEAKQETLPADGIEVAGEETLVTELQLDRPLDKYGMIELVRICLRAVYPVCLYCNYARRIAVNGKSFVLHIISQHRFTATVDSITAEELHSDTIVAKLKSYLPELEEQYLNLTSYCSWGDGTFSLPFEERQFECFQCRFMSTVHKELYLHNRKMHLRTAILCFMCRAHFFSFSEILCHICPGIPNKVSTFEVKFRCCLCNLDGIPSPFRLMVHLRKRHFVCDVCLEDCRDQSKLSAHVWKHKLHHLCYRCGIAYRNKLDITKHLFWKHGTESTICKRCLQKRWPHVYHFCIPPSQFTCESCNLCFSKAVYLRVHKRLHAGDLRYPCAADNCEEKFISRKLLLKHAVVHDAVPPNTVPEGDNKGEDNLNEEKMETENGKMLEMEREKETIIEVKEAELMKIKMEPVEDVKGGKEIAKKRPLTTLNNQENTSTTTTIAPTTATNEKPKELSCNSIISEKQKKKRRGKKHKRAKELLDDLNLTAPNLSESDSSSCDSGSDTKTKSEFDALPPVMLSPPSEAEDKEDGENKQQQEKTDEMVGKNSKSNSNTNAAGQMMEIWKNVVKTQQQQIGNKDDDRENVVTEANYTTDNYPTPRQLHVAFSDHDYCTIYSSPKSMIHSPISGTPVKLGKSPQHLKHNADNSSNSSTDSSSSSDSSCSCGSNCSCSSSDSDSSSTSSSSNHSGSSLASNNTLRKRHRKKSERDRLRKSKSESVSPQKNHNKYNTTQVNVEDIEVTEGGGGGLQSGDQCYKDKSPNGNKELSFHESDLETNESETDEEFYDEHPQKLANELLAEKRAQLLAQTRLSPSHKFDIVENSRPSTPSLPEEMMSGHEKSRVKVKKKKRDRKNPSKTLNANNLQYNNNNNNTVISNSLLQQQQHQQSTLSNSSVYTPHKWTMEQSLNITRPPAPRHHSSMLSFNNNIMGRASEGSSCSDIDASLKRSKRARRPNKFYGYTSDDETNLGQSLMIGMKSYKPQPPPQLTWRKEDLPTPSKSLLKSNRNKMNKKHRNSMELTSNSKKKLKLSLTLDEEEKSMQKRRKSSKKRENKLPPIPPLKIKQSQLALSNNNNHNINNLQAQQDHNNSTESSSSAEEEEEEDEEAEQNIVLNNISHTTAAITLPFNKTNHSFTGPPPLTNPLTALLPQAPPMPPTPQTTAFNHKIPPALLPNPDFATLQYFKANNIRYPIRPPAGARQPRDGESVYCYCRCPYDEVSEMIACDGENCLIEWFHFECVGIMVAPQGKWFCAECRPKYSEELYPTNTLQATTTTTGINNV